MARKQTSILLNGKLYDAHTGELLEAPSVVTPEIITPEAPVTTKASRSHAKHQAPTKATQAATRTNTPRSIDGIASGTPARPDRPTRRVTPAAVHPVTPSKTLMRSAVTKPDKATRLKRNSKTIAPVAVHGRQTLAAAPLARKASVTTVNEKRLAHAKSVNAHPKVSRFKTEAKAQLLSAVVEVEKEVTQAVHTVNTGLVPAVEPVTEHVRAFATPSQAETFTRALNNANLELPVTFQRTQHPRIAQTAKRTKRARKQMFGYASAAMAALAVFAVLGYYNITSIKFTVARHQAGFAAVMPSYKPTGYHVSNIESQTDALAVSYTGNGKKFALNEQPSTWSNNDIITNLVAGAPCTVTTEGGRTIYLFAGRGAWVDNGILYQVAGAIGASDIGKLAASM